MRHLYNLFAFFLVFSNLQNLLANQSIKQNETLTNLAIPQILNENDKTVYLKIKNLQLRGNWDEAQKKINTLQNKVLLGYLEYDKLMHPTKYKASYDELLIWLKTYHDFPVVMKRRAYNLMVKRRPPQKKEKSLLQKPKYGNYLRGYGENKKKYIYDNFSKKEQVKFKLNEKIVDIISDQKFKELSIIYKKNKRLRPQIIYNLKKDAEKKFNNNNIRKSLRTYKYLIDNYNLSQASIFFKAGIASYRLGMNKDARNFFNNCNKLIRISSENYHPKIISACLYWEGRLIDSKKIQNSLFTKASYYYRTMYGQLSLQKLNKKENIEWKTEKQQIVLVNRENLVDSNVFSRLIALHELKFYDKADLEMRNLYSKIEKNKKNIKFLLFLSEKLDLAAVQIRLGETFHNRDYNLYMRGLYPTPGWGFDKKFIFDRAFIYAIIKTESAFNFKAKSSKGARGLMQLMPRTASKIKKDHRLRYSQKFHLYSLDLNLELGQKLLKELVQNPSINNSILCTLVAYNAGITRLKRWNKTIEVRDPLAFIESIPILETRLFVKSILTDLWIYRDKLGQSKESRAMLANDEWPTLPSKDFYYTRDAKLR